MITRFQSRELMVQFAAEDDRNVATNPTNCPGASCQNPCIGTTFADDVTKCGSPTCKNPPVRRGAGLEERAGSNLALLQRELRSAMSLER